eukprot:9733594-Karenia_brevis.AAC.1
MAAKLEAMKMLESLRKSGDCSDEDEADDNMSDVSSVHDEKLVEKMNMDELKAELLSLTRQMSSIRDLSDPRTLKLRAFLTSEITNVRHAITKLKPVDEQISILQSALLKKKS